MSAEFKFGTWYPIDLYDKNRALEVMIAWLDLDFGGKFTVAAPAYWHSMLGSFTSPWVQFSMHPAAQPTHWMPLPPPPSSKMAEG